MRTVSAASTDRPVFHGLRPYGCTAANWRLGPEAVVPIATRSWEYAPEIAPPHGTPVKPTISERVYMGRHSDFFGSTAAVPQKDCRQIAAVLIAAGLGSQS
jgi:hypothetical protein